MFIYPSGNKDPKNKQCFFCAACSLHPGVAKLFVTTNIGSLSQHKQYPVEMETNNIPWGSKDWKGSKDMTKFCPGTLPLTMLMHHSNANQNWFTVMFGANYMEKEDKVEELAAYLDPRFEIYPNIKYPHKMENWEELADKHQHHPNPNPIPIKH